MASRIPPCPDDRSINDWRPIEVICIGAGMCGIAVGCLFPQHIPNLKLTIYEKNTDVGGTWFENHYPGLRPDLTPHVYQYTFASNPNWTRFYPPGPEFEEYLRTVARKYEVYKHVEFSHRFLSAEWFEDDAQWEVTVKRLDDGTTFKDRADILIKCTGFVNDWRWPKVPGREKFKGTMLHTANWDDNFDPEDKTVAVLGYGSTGVQITPAIQPIVKQLDHYVRGKVWVPPGGGTNTEELIERNAHMNFDHDLGERHKFSENPETYLQFRKKQESYCNNVQKIFFKDTEAQLNFTAFLDQNLKETTKKKPWLYETLKPDYPPGCRRLVMGQGWLECMQKDNANIIPKDVREFTEAGIIDEDGVERSYDAIICATGFDSKLDSNTTPIIGRNSTPLSMVWKDRPTAYMGIQPEQMPNLFLMFGPNSAPFAGSIVHTFEACAHYIIKCVKKIQREYIKSMVCKPLALKSWIKHVDRHMGKTVMSASCVTWFKRNEPNGPVVTLWPGSAMHGYFGWENPRFEDFEYTSWLPEDDPFGWIGNGNTLEEKTGEGDTTLYMDYTDVSKVLHVSTTDYPAPGRLQSALTNGLHPN
ncbi:uncharacterized protein A1O5_09404 [Cladophialophora psammophila CBS 110553]|uniref:FAD/NAD(P)-binding domain-containing protein n=1 Tax=Cladophialophora psammophila CBS 110553 TaxID=1182543 RepID=W9WRX5_9EURO|nr:uncharacterized protein A1O5_09404 [Cladophialophora psammophila CBS 110553]EXJ67391.1 hypothetical protein A1O5_09404 [Cladophialophora psammophila CBS 110553]